VRRASSRELRACLYAVAAGRTLMVMVISSPEGGSVWMNSSCSGARRASAGVEGTPAEGLPVPKSGTMCLVLEPGAGEGSDVDGDALTYAKVAGGASSPTGGSRGD
jgi:hypothetical protein